MQIELVTGLPPSGDFENIVTAMDVFFRYLFAYPTSNQDAKTIAKVSSKIMTKHAYLSTTLISDKSTAFISHVTKVVAGTPPQSTVKQLGYLSDLTRQTNRHSR